MAEAFPIAAVKTGMLPTKEIVETVAELIADLKFPHVVVDPVIIASVGARLVEEEAEKAISDKLVPLATLLTPNMAEAAALAGIQVENLVQMGKAGEILRRKGAIAVVVTGGHLEEAAMDVLVDSSGVIKIPAYKEKGSIHGTGCSFSSAAAAALAKGADTVEAVKAAKAYIKKLFAMQQWRTE
jgi:hydroxymethylpyrimidine kinase/phosphomethylpyrimidine kinase